MIIMVNDALRNLNVDKLYIKAKILPIYLCNVLHVLRVYPLRPSEF
jgi:hypothetical protein